MRLASHVALRDSQLWCGMQSTGHTYMRVHLSHFSFFFSSFKPLFPFLFKDLNTFFFLFSPKSIPTLNGRSRRITNGWLQHVPINNNGTHVWEKYIQGKTKNKKIFWVNATALPPCGRVIRNKMIKSQRMKQRWRVKLHAGSAWLERQSGGRGRRSLLELLKSLSSNLFIICCIPYRSIVLSSIKCIGINDSLSLSLSLSFLDKDQEGPRCFSCECKIEVLAPWA